MYIYKILDAIEIHQMFSIIHSKGQKCGFLMHTVFSKKF